MKSKKLEMYIDIQNNLVYVGTFFVDIVRYSEKYSFIYSNEYLALKKDYLMDPELPLQDGRIYKKDSSSMFGCLQDSTPDRWGHKIIDKLIDNGKPFFESDYLCLISDNLRNGALRIKDNNDFIDKSTIIPKYIYLNKLEHAALNFESNVDEDLKMLLVPGSSLGGARPKANVYNNDNEIYIAKFPSKNDEYDVELWEKVVNDLASLCGINVPISKLVKVSQRGSTFLTKRFDRDGDKRIHFISFMTLLNAKDGESGNYSYLDIVEIIKSKSNYPKKDLLELFKRVAFNIIIHNSDDHLRNHGFINDGVGVTLSPAFDLNPILNAHFLTLSIDGNSFEFDLNTLIKTAKYYDMSDNEACNIVDSMKKIARDNWVKLANKYKAKEEEIKLMSKIFTLE